MERKSDVLIITNKGGVSLAKKLFQKKSLPDTEIVALDSIISYLLTKNGLKNTNIYSLINKEREKELYKQAKELIFLECDKNKKNESLDDFFDYLKIDFLDQIMEPVFYKIFFKEILIKLNPSKVYLFDYPDDQTQLLKEEIIKNNLPISLYPINLIDRLGIFAINFLPYIGRERKHYNDLIQRIKLDWLKILKSRLKSLGQNDFQSNNVLIGVFSQNSQIKELALFLTNLKNNKISIISLIDSQLLAKDYFPMIKNNLNYHLINTTKLILKRDQRINFDFFSDSLVLNKLSLKFNWLKKYESYQNLNKTIGIILDKTKPKVVIGVDQFLWPTGVLIKQAQIRNIETVLVSDTSNHIYQFDCLQDNPRKNDIRYKANHIITLNRQIAESYQKDNNISDNPVKTYSTGSLKFDNWLKKKELLKQSAEDYRMNFLKRFHLPNKSKIILFTTQQHTYSLDYIRLLSQTILDISQEKEFADYYLVIKVHPLEFKTLYQLFGFNRTNKKIIITQNDDLYNLISIAECLITYYSFTAIEALALEKTVLILDFLHRNDRTIILKESSVKIIDSVSDLSDQLKIILRDNKNKNHITITQEITKILNLPSNPVKSYQEIIKSILNNKIIS